MEYLRDAEPLMPPELSERAEEGWTCLFAIAELAGDEWPERCWVASETLSVGIERESQSFGVSLLADIRSAFGEKDRISTEKLLEYLNGLDESPWGGWGRVAGINYRDVAKLVKPYGIGSKDIRFGPDNGKVLKGYWRSHFEDAWARYLPSEEATSATGDTNHVDKESATIGQNPSNVAHESQIETPYGVAPVAPRKPMREGGL
jgi:hypothetical protein